MRDRPVDDLLITFKDLFPCLGPLLETCGCARRKSRRQLARGVPTPPTNGPRVEQVCLDCGNVLESRPVPGTVAIDMFDRGCAQRHEAYLDVTGQNAPKPVTFPGYNDWDTNAPSRAYGSSNIALPQFEPGPARRFLADPTQVQTQTEEEFISDDTGHIKLPDFPLPK